MISQLSSVEAPRPAAVPTIAPVDLFERHLQALYAFAQKNEHLFASPLGPISYGGRHAWLPRFVFFGPNCADDSWRLAFLAGFNPADMRPAHALLRLIEMLVRHSEEGHGLHLTFVPLVDVAGLTFHPPARGLDRANWANSDAPEIGALAHDARLSGYHGFIRVETAPAGDDTLSIRVRAPGGVEEAPDVEIISSLDVDPFSVRWERNAGDERPVDGPLSIADDFPVQPFELTLRIPGNWNDDLYNRAVSTIMGRFLLRYRAFQAYAQHL